MLLVTTVLIIGISKEYYCYTDISIPYVDTLYSRTCYYSLTTHLLLTYYFSYYFLLPFCYELEL